MGLGLWGWDGGLMGVGVRIGFKVYDEVVAHTADLAVRRGR